MLSRHRLITNSWTIERTFIEALMSIRIMRNNLTQRFTLVWCTIIPETTNAHMVQFVNKFHDDPGYGPVSDFLSSSSARIMSAAARPEIALLRRPGVQKLLQSVALFLDAFFQWNVVGTLRCSSGVMSPFGEKTQPSTPLLASRILFSFRESQP